VVRSAPTAPPTAPTAPTVATALSPSAQRIRDQVASLGIAVPPACADCGELVEAKGNAVGGTVGVCGPCASIRAALAEEIADAYLFGVYLRWPRHLAGQPDVARDLGLVAEALTRLHEHFATLTDAAFAEAIDALCVRAREAFRGEAPTVEPTVTPTDTALCDRAQHSPLLRHRCRVRERFRRDPSAVRRALLRAELGRLVERLSRYVSGPRSASVRLLALTIADSEAREVPDSTDRTGQNTGQNTKRKSP
jgi:hypothetical protein